MEEKGCPICRGRLVRKKETYWFGSMNLGEFEADVCGKCGEVFYTEEASDQIDQMVKKAGVWGIGRKVVIGQSGNALIVRIPKEIAELYNLHKKITALITPECKNKICIEVKG
jgi:YgiT-type zinc finger domain-containing protein